MPVVRNPQFYFKEGFCWSDINTTYLKCRIKEKSINDVKSMSLYGLINSCPEYYIISIINSTFISEYVDVFVNNTQTFQINDARQLPIIIPDKEELSKIKIVFDEAIRIKKQVFDFKIDESVANAKLQLIQHKLDLLVRNIYMI